MKFQSLNALAALVAGSTAAPHPGGKSSLHNRATAELVGDGSPRQAYLYKQVTATVKCGSADTCAVDSEIESYTISADTDASFGSWLEDSGASESFDIGDLSVATCAPSDDSVCIWVRVAHTGWEVETGGDPYYVWTPNTELGHATVCGYGDECQAKGDEQWGYMSEGDRLWSAVSNKGGPQAFVWGEDEANRWN